MQEVKNAFTEERITSLGECATDVLEEERVLMDVVDHEQGRVQHLLCRDQMVDVCTTVVTTRVAGAGQRTRDRPLVGAELRRAHILQAEAELVRRSRAHNRARVLIR
jgi:hypothetical protein